MQKYANPRRFLTLQSAVQPYLTGLTVLLFAIGLYLGLVKAPADYQQGETVRIMFVHVPAASMALGVYVIMAIASAVAIIFRHPVADLAAKAAAPTGAALTFLALATGAIWGKPTWGTWWEWGDARLTSMFVLLLLYLGYMAIWQAIEDPQRAAPIARIVAIVGVINVPIIKFSVEWWNTLHQPASLLRVGGPSIHSSILVPLLVMMAAYFCLVLSLHLYATRAEILKRRLRQMELARIDRA